MVKKLLRVEVELSTKKKMVTPLDPGLGEEFFTMIALFQVEHYWFRLEICAMLSYSGVLGPFSAHTHCRYCSFQCTAKGLPFSSY